MNNASAVDSEERAKIISKLRVLEKVGSQRVGQLPV